MKRAIHPTSHILIRANKNNDFEPVHFAIKELTEDWLILVQRRFMMTRSLAHNKDFYADTFWDWPIDYCRNPDNRNLAEEVLEAGEDWAYINLEPGELESLVAPDRLDAHQLLITASGLALFKAYGKYTGEEYATDEFSLTSILKMPCTT